MDEKDWITEILTSTGFTPVQRRILSQLPGLDLLDCARVCKRWKTEVEWILFRRPQFCCHTAMGTEKNNHNSHLIWNDIKQYIRNVPVVAGHLVVYLSRTLWKALRDRRCVSSTDLTKDLLRHVPTGCVISGAIVQDGLIGTTQDLRETCWLEGWELAVSVLVIKRRSDLTLLPVALSRLQLRDWRDVFPPDPMYPALLARHLPHLTELGTPVRGPVVCLASSIISVVHNGSLQEDELLIPPVMMSPSLYSNQVPKVVSSAFGLSSPDCTALQCLLFHGDDVDIRLHAQQAIKTGAHLRSLEQAYISMKKVLKPESAGFGLLFIAYSFSCRASRRRLNSSLKRNHMALRRHFPKTPFIGVTVHLGESAREKWFDTLLATAEGSGMKVCESGVSSAHGAGWQNQPEQRLHVHADHVQNVQPAGEDGRNIPQANEVRLHDVLQQLNGERHNADVHHDQAAGSPDKDRQDDVDEDNLGNHGDDAHSQGRCPQEQGDSDGGNPGEHAKESQDDVQQFDTGSNEYTGERRETFETGDDGRGCKAGGKQTRKPKEATDISSANRPSTTRGSRETGVKEPTALIDVHLFEEHRGPQPRTVGHIEVHWSSPESSAARGHIHTQHSERQVVTGTAEPETDRCISCAPGFDGETTSFARKDSNKDVAKVAVKRPLESQAAKGPERRRVKKRNEPFIRLHEAICEAECEDKENHGSINGRERVLLESKPDKANVRKTHSERSTRSPLSSLSRETESPSVPAVRCTEDTRSVEDFVSQSSPTDSTHSPSYFSCCLVETSQSSVDSHHSSLDQNQISPNIFDDIHQSVLDIAESPWESFCSRSEHKHPIEDSGVHSEQGNQTVGDMSSLKDDSLVGTDKAGGRHGYVGRTPPHSNLECDVDGLSPSAAKKKRLAASDGSSSSLSSSPSPTSGQETDGFSCSYEDSSSSASDKSDGDTKPENRGAACVGECESTENSDEANSARSKGRQTTEVTHSSSSFNLQIDNDISLSPPEFPDEEGASHGLFTDAVHEIEPLDPIHNEHRDPADEAQQPGNVGGEGLELDGRFPVFPRDYEGSSDDTEYYYDSDVDLDDEDYEDCVFDQIIMFVNVGNK